MVMTKLVLNYFIMSFLELTIATILKFTTCKFPEQLKNLNSRSNHRLGAVLSCF